MHSRAGLYSALGCEPHTDDAELQAIRVRYEIERRGCVIEDGHWRLPDGRVVASLWDAAAALIEASHAA